MHFPQGFSIRAWTVLIFLIANAFANAQEPGPGPGADGAGAVLAAEASPNSDQDPATSSNAAQAPAPDQDAGRAAQSSSSDSQNVPASQQQPKRILGVMPNFRAVSAGASVAPPTWKSSFKIATQNSFDYSAFVFVGVTSGLADASGAHTSLGHGVPGYWAYYWRGFVDKTDGNYLVLFALPGILHEDERYFAMGHTHGIAKRFAYASTRIFVTRNYEGHNVFNASELLGRAAAQGISTTYYPSADRTAGALVSRLGYAMMRDALTQVFREFWPDIATHVLHRHP